MTQRTLNASNINALTATPVLLLLLKFDLLVSSDVTCDHARNVDRQFDRLTPTTVNQQRSTEFRQRINMPSS